ncbi:hypothetical protein CDCA_CDCA04G1353 [Cyanidium caldarium]|uniref:rRNA biogenesis protein RRP36 n=1 Tax=Cyanidium caldarium TaxID=2771 RepID=A0AAV9ITC3_CYACA|nr:hypothetical protein CDCA_CDCA04G1353 [Cyanidium caldarium]
MARGKRHCHRHNEVEDQREVADESVAGASFRKAPENTQTSERGGAEGATLAERVRRMREERRRQLRRTAATAKDAPTALKRPNKNCPQVLPVSDGRRPTTAPEVVSRAGQKPIDPRFETVSGRFEEATFRKRYGFVRELQREALERSRTRLSEVERAIRRAPATAQATLAAERASIASEIARREQALRRAEEMDRSRQIVAEHQRAEREKLQSGQKQRPFFLKRRQVKEQLLREKYDRLRQEGKLQRTIQRSRKRRAAKDRKLLEYRSGSIERTL